MALHLCVSGSRPQRWPEQWWQGDVWSGDFCSISSHDTDRDPETKWFSDLNMRNSHSSETLAWLCAGLGIIQLSASSFSHWLSGSWEPDRYTPGKWTGRRGHTSTSFSAVLTLKVDGLVCFCRNQLYLWLFLLHLSLELASRHSKSKGKKMSDTSVLVYFCCCNKLPHMYAVAQSNTDLLSYSPGVQKSQKGPMRLIALNNTNLLSYSPGVQKSQKGPMRLKSRSQQSCTLSGGSRENLFLVCFKKSFWPDHKACGILVPWPGIKPTSPALESWSLNH